MPADADCGPGGARPDADAAPFVAALARFCGLAMAGQRRAFLERQQGEILREMEPPRHDTWDPNHPEKNAHRKTALEFMAYIRDCISQLAPASNDTVLNIPELSQWGRPHLFGPGSVHVAHRDDEHVRISELRAAVDAYERLGLAALDH